MNCSADQRGPDSFWGDSWDFQSWTGPLCPLLRNMQNLKGTTRCIIPVACRWQGLPTSQTRIILWGSHVTPGVLTEVTWHFISNFPSNTPYLKNHFLNTLVNFVNSCQLCYSHCSPPNLATSCCFLESTQHIVVVAFKHSFVSHITTHQQLEIFFQLGKMDHSFS